MNKIVLFFFVALSSNIAMAENIWVSDEIEAPLRSSPELNSTIVGLLPSGQKVSVLEKKEKYIKIKTSDGKTGWLSSYYVLKEQSVHDKYLPAVKELAASKKELATLKSQTSKANAELKEKSDKDSTLLQKKLELQNSQITELTEALESSKESSTDAKAQYLSLIKTSENVVAIDKQNRSLQERTVRLEQDLQLLKNENQSLQSKVSGREKLTGAGLILAGFIFSYFLPWLLPRRKSSYSSF